MPTIAVYGTPTSGHTHRAVLMLSLLGVPFERVDGSAAVRKTPAFLLLNPLGQVPVVVDGDVVIPDSNAILVYLAKRYGPAWLPEEPVAAARVQRWLSFAAGEIRYGCAAARLITIFGREGDVARARAIAVDSLRFVDGELEKGGPFVVGAQPTIADVSLYPYIAHAPEGRVALEPYPAVRAWIARVEALPGFLAMQKSAIPHGAA